MFRIEAPFSGPYITIVLPSPNWGNSQEVSSTLSTIYTMNGLLFTYIHRKQARKKLVWDFEISRNKALELRAFFMSYYYTKVKIVDHDNNTWAGYFMNNPFEFAGSAKAKSFPGGEMMTITLEFEEDF